MTKSHIIDGQANDLTEYSIYKKKCVASISHLPILFIFTDSFVLHCILPEMDGRKRINILNRMLEHFLQGEHTQSLSTPLWSLLPLLSPWLSCRPPKLSPFPFEFTTTPHFVSICGELCLAWDFVSRVGGKQLTFRSLINTTLGYHVDFLTTRLFVPGGFVCFLLFSILFLLRQRYIVLVLRSNVEQKQLQSLWYSVGNW